MLPLPRVVVIVLTTAALAAVYFWCLGGGTTSPGGSGSNFRSQRNHDSHASTTSRRFPTALMDLGVYQARDFRPNAAGVTVPFWDDFNVNSTSSSAAWGPCYAPSEVGVDWPALVQAHHGNSSINNQHTISLYDDYKPGRDVQDVDGSCRPGFLIIGAGKCGTRYVVENVFVGSCDCLL